MKGNNWEGGIILDEKRYKGGREYICQECGRTDLQPMEYFYSFYPEEDFPNPDGMIPKRNYLERGTEIVCTRHRPKVSTGDWEDLTQEHLAQGVLDKRGLPNWRKFLEIEIANGRTEL